MKRLFLIALVFFSARLLGQIQVVGNVPMPEARITINNNFAYLDAKQLTGTTLPANCTTGQIFTKTNAPAGSNMYVALSTGTPCTTWTQQAGGGASGAGPANAVQATNGSGALVDSGCTATAGQITCPSGFVTGLSTPALSILNCGAAPVTPPVSGKVAEYCDSTNLGVSVMNNAGVVTRTIKPTTCAGGTVVSSINADGTVTCVSGGTGSGYSTVQDEGTGLTPRATINFIGSGITCADNAGATKTDCTISGGTGSATAGTVYTQSFSSVTSVTLAHNLGLSPTTAFTGQCFDGSGNVIVPANLAATSANAVTATFGSAQSGSCTINAGGGSHFYSATMTSAATWTIAGTTHLLGTCDLDIMAWDAATGVRHKVQPADIACDDTAGAFTVTLTFGVAQAGRVVLIAAK